MRVVPIEEEECYHIFNRGTRKQTIFHDHRDWLRFLFLITHFQSPLTFTNISYDTKLFARNFNEHSVLIKKKREEEICGQRTVELIAFSLMPNHFHLIVREVKEGGISAYMQRVLNAYTKYYNAKYEANGHLFQGPFRVVHINDNEQLLYVSAYVHLNPKELDLWKAKPSGYPWSSYQDYLGPNRWGELLSQSLISEQFDSPAEYQKWVETSGAKSDDLEEISEIEN